MKISSSILKSLWLFAVVFLIMIARGLPVWALILLAIVLLALPLAREFRKKSDLDERHLQIGHFSSHVALYAFLALTLLIMINDFISKGNNPDNKWYMLLIVPLVVKFIFSLIQNYGAAVSGRWIGYVFASIWILFALLSHGLSFGTLIESAPFLLLVGAAWFSKKKPFISGIIFAGLAVTALFFFSGWAKMDIYGRILMYSLIPLPVFISGVALIISSWSKKSPIKDV